MKNILVITLFSACSYVGSSEPATILTGEPVPDICFDDVHYGTQRAFSTKDLHGKPAIIYFFSLGCHASFESLPQLELIYEQYKLKVDFILVGLDFDDNIQGNYDVYRKKYNLHLPVAFDQTVYKQYSIYNVPYVVWINRDGIVHAETNVVNADHVVRLIKGLPFTLIDYSKNGRETLMNVDTKKPFLITGNIEQDTAFIQRSLLSQWKKGMPVAMPSAEGPQSPLANLNSVQVYGRELADLYRMAYFGRTYAWGVDDTVAYGNFHYGLSLEIRDKSKFESDYDTGKNLFCYSLIMPKNRTPEQIMALMRRDLKNFFGYDVTVEEREMPYLALVATDRAKRNLLNTGKRGKSFNDMISIRLVNVPMRNVVTAVSTYTDLVTKNLPLIDETGIKDNIDISFHAVLTDFDDIRTALHEQGLNIVKKKKPMKVIVIRAAKN